MRIERPPCPREGALLRALARSAALPSDLDRHRAGCTRCRRAVAVVEALRALGERAPRGWAGDEPGAADASALWRVGMARRRLRRREEAARGRVGHSRPVVALVAAPALTAGGLLAWRLAEILAGILPTDPMSLVFAVAGATAATAGLLTLLGLDRMRRSG